MENAYFLAVNIVGIKFSKDDLFYPLYVVGVYSLLRKYAGYEDAVVDSFLNTDIYFEKGPILDIVVRHNFDEKRIDGLRERQKTFDVYALSDLGSDFNYDKERGELKFINTRPYIVSDTDRFSNEELLNSFCHELGHIIKSKIRGFKIVDNGEESNEIEFFFRSGVSYDSYFTKNGDMYNIKQSIMLDELINVFHTTEALSEVEGLKSISVDEDINKFISKLDYKKLSQDSGYNDCIPLFRKLWNNELFQNAALESSLTGSDALFRTFDALGDNVYNTLGRLLDKYYDLILNNGDRFEIKGIEYQILDIINKYNKKYKDYVKQK